MPVPAKPQTKQKAVKPPARQSKARRAASRPVTKADLDEFRAEILLTIERALRSAALPPEPCDEATRAEIEAALADPGPNITHEALRRELGL